MDFYTTEVWTLTGLRTYYTLFAIDLKTRAVAFVGTTTNPDGGFMAQVARTMTGVMEGWLRHKRLLLSDNDKKYTAQFRRILNDAGLRSLKLPTYAPDSNAFAERFVRSVKSECLERMILFGEGALWRALLGGRQVVGAGVPVVRDRRSTFTPADWPASAACTSAAH